MLGSCFCVHIFFAWLHSRLFCKYSSSPFLHILATKTNLFMEVLWPTYGFFFFSSRDSTFTSVFILRYFPPFARMQIVSRAISYPQVCLLYYTPIWMFSSTNLNGTCTLAMKTNTHPLMSQSIATSQDLTPNSMVAGEPPPRCHWQYPFFRLARLGTCELLAFWKEVLPSDDNPDVVGGLRSQMWAEIIGEWTGMKRWVLECFVFS